MSKEREMHGNKLALNKKGSSYRKYILIGAALAILIVSLFYWEREREMKRAISVIENMATKVFSDQEFENGDIAKLHIILKHVQDKSYQQGFDQGKEKGTNEGRKATQKILAVKALAEGLSCETVSKITDMDLTEVNALEKIYITKPFRPFDPDQNNTDKSNIMPEKNQ